VVNAAGSLYFADRVDSDNSSIRLKQGTSRWFGVWLRQSRSTRPVSRRLAFSTDADHASSTRRRSRPLDRRVMSVGRRYFRCGAGLQPCGSPSQLRTHSARRLDCGRRSVDDSASG